MSKYGERESKHNDVLFCQFENCNEIAGFKGEPGRPPKWCAAHKPRELKRQRGIAAKAARKAAREQAKTREVHCAAPGCAEIMVRTGSRGRLPKWCAAHRPRYQDSSSKTCTEPGCDRPRRARELCNMHLRRFYRAEGIEKNPEWDERRKKNKRIRIERLNGGRDRDPKILAALIASGNLVCPECGEAIDLELKYPDPLSRTIDHIIPIARGGKHQLANCQLMHLVCNERKGTRVPGDI